MPYTPPSISPTGLQPVSPVRSSYSYAGLTNGSSGSSPPLTSKHTQPHNNPLHPNHVRPMLRPTIHHRRSSGPSSPPRAPIPVASFATSQYDKSSPTRPAPIRTDSSSTYGSNEDDETVCTMPTSSPQRHERHLANLQELRDAIREQLPQRKSVSPPGSPERRFLQPNAIAATDHLSPCVRDCSYDPTNSDGEQSSPNTPPEETVDSPRMVRKKSGEIVKPSLKTSYLRRRPLSLPSTPLSKAVHFDVQLEHVRHFLHSEKPLAVSADPSPDTEYGSASEFPFADTASSSETEKQYQVELPNFPTGDRVDFPIRVESVYLSSNSRNLVGKVLAKNIAFSKWVAVRFTFDRWQTVSEVSATYEQTGDSNKPVDWDRFVFTVRLEDITHLEQKQMLFCVRYNVAEQEFWDNNYGANYQVEFRKRPNFLLRRQTPSGRVNRLGAGSSLDDSVIGGDFDVETLEPETFAKNLAQQISSPRSSLLANLGESPPLVKKTMVPISSSSSSSDLPINGTPKKTPTGKAFANRYDFGASLNAAIVSANAAMGFDQSNVPKNVLTKPGSRDYFSPSPLLFKQNAPLRSAAEMKEEKPLTNHTKKSHLSALLQSHHFRSRSYPLGSTSQATEWPGNEDDVTNGYSSDDGVEKPPMGSTSYLDFINTYCFVYSVRWHC
jgi:Carbohydrate/starch-binding module (family 21)